jgi:hypothetical protein
MAIKNKKFILIFSKEKKAWIRILEAFFAVILIMGILLVVINKNLPTKEYSKETYIQTKKILQEIEFNKNLRKDIINVEPLPITWKNFKSKGLKNVRDKIIEKTPNYLNCSAKLCEIEEECVTTILSTRNIYTNAIGIYAINSKYSPRKLKLYCWEI